MLLTTLSLFHVVAGFLSRDQRHTIFDRDFSYLAQTVTTATPKLTIPSPSMVHYRGGTAAKLLGKESIQRPGSPMPDLDAVSAADAKRVWKVITDTPNWWLDLAAYEPAQIARLYQLARRFRELAGFTEEENDSLSALARTTSSTSVASAAPRSSGVASEPSSFAAATAWWSRRWPYRSADKPKR